MQQGRNPISDKLILAVAISACPRSKQVDLIQSDNIPSYWVNSSRGLWLGWKSFKTAEANRVPVM